MGRQRHDPRTRRPLVAAGAGLLAAAMVVRHGTGPDGLMALALATFLLPVALIDLDRRVIPDRITGPAALVGLALAAAVDPSSLPERAVAAAAAGGAFLVVALISPEGMGMGDVKLVAVLGLYLGSAVAPALAVALVSGTLAGVAVMVRRGVREGRRATLPFGPFLALGALVALLAGPALVDLYVGGG